MKFRRNIVVIIALTMFVVSIISGPIWLNDQNIDDHQRGLGYFMFYFGAILNFISGWVTCIAYLFVTDKKVVW